MMGINQIQTAILWETSGKFLLGLYTVLKENDTDSAAGDAHHETTIARKGIPFPIQTDYSDSGFRFSANGT